MDETDAPSFAFPEGVLVRKVENEMVLLNLNTEQYYGLDTIGAEIVARLTRSPVDHVVETLCRDYEVSAPQLRTDIDHLVFELLDAGLLTRVSPHG